MSKDNKPANQKQHQEQQQQQHPSKEMSFHQQFLTPYSNGIALFAAFVF